jgi:sulfur relay (sulfurtransferase) complex TusBCD TusD component (DsrE family)
MVLAGFLSGILAATIFAQVVQPQNSLTLAWDVDSGGGVAGYNVYYGVASRNYTSVVSAGNTGQATINGLTSGTTYFFAVTAYDATGLESGYSDEISYTVPFPTNTLPTITLTSPANGTVSAAPASINVAAGVAANGHSITQVQFYNGVTLLGAVASAPYGFSWNNVSPGTYSLSAIAVYDSGSTVSSAAANVKVAARRLPFGFADRLSSGLADTLPTITLTSPANGTVSAAPASINVAAGVAANGHSIIEVQFYNGATLLGAVGSAPYTLAWNNVSAGTYSLSAIAVYDSGSTVSSAAANVKVAARRLPFGFADRLPSGLADTLPTITLTSPANGTVSAAPASINVAAAVAANGHSIIEVQFYNGVTLLGVIGSAPYTFAWDNMSAGTYSLSALAVYDSGSTVSSAAANVKVAARRLPSGIADTPPTITLTSPANGTVSAAPASINVAAGVAANGHSIIEVQFYNGAMLLGVVGSAPYTLAWNNVSAGTYSLSALAVYDSGSTVSSAAANVKVAARRLPSGLSIVAPPGLQIQIAPGGSVLLSGTGQAGQPYNVLASQDLKTWTLIGTMTLDETGSGQFTDPAGTSLPNCVYRLQGQ